MSPPQPVSSTTRDHMKLACGELVLYPLYSSSCSPTFPSVSFPYCQPTSQTSSRICESTQIKVTSSHSPTTPSHSPTHHPSPACSHPPPVQRGPYYIARFDYTATSSDEVSFRKGDTIINAEFASAGWMTGTVERTGQSGMLPSSYMEPGP